MKAVAAALASVQVGQLTIQCEYREGIKGRDYYEESMAQHFTQLLSDRASTVSRILILAAGHGLSAIAMAQLTPGCRVVASDINPRALDLIRDNAASNGVGDHIDVRRHERVYDSVRPGELFDVIISALPPVPVTVADFATLGERERAHHVGSEWGLGGSDGRKLIDHMILEAPRYLTRCGEIVHVHADFLGSDRTLETMRHAGFKARIIGGVTQRLSGTALTLARKRAIEDLGYVFRLDQAGEPYFAVQTFHGRLNS